MDEAGEPRHWLDNPPTVAAVLVAHNGAAWLPKTLASISQMFTAPDHWHVVDVSSTDGSADLLRESFGAERITYAPSGTGFGAAVGLALESLPPTDWVWLLHDDCSVLPGTLAGLLDVASQSPDIAVVGPKIREWPSLRRLLEVGLTVTSTGRRETGLETGEPDAGQHDRPSDVLAVNTAGMLVRRDVLDELDGFDPELPLFFDDIDFGWRVNRAGYRVRTAPTAVIFHAESSTRGNRRRTAGDVHHWEPRRAALFTMLANTPMPQFLWQFLRLFFGSLLRTLGFLLGKDPEAASDELLAVRSVYLRPAKLFSARKRRRATARVPAKVVAPLLAPFWLPYQHGLDAVRETATALIRPETLETAGRRSSVLDQDVDDDLMPEAGPSWWARHPWLSTMLGLLVATVIAGRGLWSTSLHGGALLPAPDTAGGWWSLVLGGTDTLQTWPPPFALLLAAVSTPVWFAPGLVQAGLVLMAVPLAALTAHRFGRLLSAQRRPRIIWALSYALTVAGIGAVSQGRIGTVVALVILPVIANTAWQLERKPGWQVGLRLGLWIAVASAFAPIVFILSIAGFGVLTYIRGRGLGRELLAAALVPVVLLGPWMVQRVLHPWRVWWEAGMPLPGAASLTDVALGRAGGISAPAWLSIPIIVLALLAFVPRRTRWSVHYCWLVAVIALAVALVGSSVTTNVPSSPAQIEPWVGVPAAIWLAGLMTAVLMAWPAVDELPRRAVAALAVAALVVPIGTATWWVMRGEADLLTVGRVNDVPAFLADLPGDTLILTGSIDDGIDYRVLEGDGPYLGQEAVAIPAGQRSDLTATVQRLVSQPDPSDLDDLARQGIDAIYAPDVDTALASRIDAAPSLAPAGSDRPGSRVWTLVTEPQSVDRGSWTWSRLAGGVSVVLWAIAVLMTTPVRRRAIPLTVDEDESNESGDDA